MKKHYKTISYQLALLLVLLIGSSSVFAVNLTVQGIASPSGANGTYIPYQTGVQDGKDSWIHENGGYYIYSYNFSGTHYWYIDDDYAEDGSSLFYDSEGENTSVPYDDGSRKLDYTNEEGTLLADYIAPGSKMFEVVTVAASTVAPTVSTQTVSSIATTTATGNGNVTATGGANITERGVYYSTTNGFADGTGIKVSTTGTWSSTGTYTQAITGLTQGTTYYVKAFATNSAGTGYGSQVSFATLAPEINIKGNGADIGDGDTSPSTGDFTDFGSVAAASGTISRTFTIQNTGTATLTLGSNAVSVSGGQSGDFTITDQPATSIAAGGSDTFTILFDPSDVGVRSTTVNIANDDSNENPYNFSITGTGTNSAPSVQATNVTLSSTSPTTASVSWTRGNGNKCVVFMAVASSGSASPVDNTIYYASSGDFTSGSPIGATGWKCIYNGTGTSVTASYLTQGTTYRVHVCEYSEVGSSRMYLTTDGTNNPNNVTTLAPEINLVGSGNSIAFGAVTPSATNHTDFGSVLAASGTILRTFTIQNTGGYTLMLSGTPRVALSGTHASDFSVTTLPASFAASAGQTDFVITFNPSGTGVRSATVSIPNDDADRTPYTFAIQGTGLNSAPTNISLSATAVNENVAGNTTVGSLTSTDADTGDTYTYSLVAGDGSDDNGSFSIDGSSLRITNSPNYEEKSSYAVRIQTSDGTDTYSKAFTITINDINDAPTDISLSASSVNENVTANTVVGTFSSTDPDAGNTFTYALVAGDGATDNGSFNISGTSLRIANSPNYESKNSYSIRVRSTDQGGLQYEKAFTITINDVNETPYSVDLSTHSFYENVVANSIIATITNNDQDLHDTYTYTFYHPEEGDDNSQFTIDGDKLRINISPDYETKSSYTVGIRVTDSGGLSGATGLYITVLNLNDAPSFTVGANKTVAQNAGAQSFSNFLTNINDGDVPAVQTITFHVSNDNNGLFTAQPSVDANGTLTFTPDATKIGKATITVYATDDGGTDNGGVDQSASQTFSIYVTPVGIKINELNVTPSDQEFVELYNSSGATMNLDGLVLVFFNGGAANDPSYKIIDLDGYSISSNGLFVAGDNAVTNVDRSTGFSTATSDIQDGYDAVALFVGNGADYPANAHNNGLIDAIVYGSSDDADLRSILGGVSLYSENANGNSSTESLSRTPDGAATIVAQKATPGTINDVTPPTVLSVNVPANGTYGPGSNMDFTVNTSENVVVTTAGGTPQLSVTIGTTTRYAVYISGTGTSALLFRYTVQVGDLDSDGIAVVGLSVNGGTMQDAVGNDMNADLAGVASTTGVLVDAVAPVVTSVSIPDGTYITGQNMDFTVNVDENATVVTAGGTPRLAITVGGTTRYAGYQSGSGTSSLVFRYTVQSGEVDSDGIALGSLSVNGGTIKDATGNDLNTTLNGVASTAAVLVDAVAPTVLSVSSQKANGTYGIGELINIEVVFSENMAVTGAPQLALETGVVDRLANYASGSGSNTLVFAYTLQSGDESVDLDYSMANALTLNSGTIKDVPGNNAVLTLAAPGAANSLGSNKALVIEAFPSVTLSVGSASISEDSGSSSITATLSEISTQDVVVSLSYSGTAVSGTDYGSNASSSITVPAGSLSANSAVGVSALQDVLAEGNETVIIDISSVSKGVENGTQQQTITIVDDDLPVASLSQSVNSFSEAGGTNTITVSLSNAFSSDVTVTIGVSILCTAEINTDFTLSPTTIVIAAGNTSGTATITALQDLADESDESVIVDIVSCVNAFENGVQQVTSLIVDDDVLPSLTTDAVTVIGNTTASLGGNITDSGTQAVTERGVVFSSTNATPMLDWIGVTSDSNGSGTGTFSELIGSLLPHKVYYVQAYATSAVGTAYGGVQTFTTTYPEINVKGNGQTIADGDATPSTADYTDLGSVFAASGTIVKTFTIENTGNGTLTLGANAVTFSGTNATDFTVSSAPSVTIAAGASTTFDVTFDPGAKGARTASLVIANDDSDENPYNFGIQGTGLNSAPTVSGLVSDVTVKEDVLSNIDLSAATFADADGDALTVTITASAGTISSVLSGAVTVNGSGTAVLTLSGTAANINTFLDTPSNIQYVGVWNQNGDNAASLAMNVNDGAVNPLLGSVNIDITAQNDDPVMTGLPTDITVLEDVAGNVDLSSATFSDVDAGVGTVSITLLVGEGTLTALSGAGVTISGSGTSGLTLSGTVANIDAYLNTASNIKYTGALDASGDNVTTLRLNADDNGNTGEGGGGSVLLGTVNIDITAVNDKPSFTIGSNKTVAQNAGAQSYVGFIANISDGDAEVTQAVSFHVSNSNTALFTTQPAISSDGTLTFSLDATKFGKSIVTVYATDDGGTANGGTNQSLNQTFKLFVTPVGISINELNTYASTSEFIELYNNNGSIMNLDGLVVVFFNGDAVNDAVYKSSIDLDGYSLSAKDFFVIGDDGVANLDMSLGATDIQDGTDAVALFVGDQSDFTVGTAATSDGLVDAVVYGSSDDATLRSILGNVSLINENANEQRATESISRWPDGTGNLGAQAATPGVTNDVIAPTVVSVSSSNIDNTYKTGDLIAVTITFSESVVVTGTPILLLNSGGTALYVSGTGTTNLTFNYTVATGNSSADLDYSATTSLSFSGGSIKDIAGNTATLTLPAVGGLNSLGGQKNIVVDGILPTVLAVSSTSANSVYGIGTSVSVTITFSEPMTVTGTPVLSLNSGGIATYVSTNASDLTFNYVVSTGNSSSDLDYQATNSLSLAGGTINDLAGNNASLTLPAVGSANSLGGQKNIVVDGVVPSVSYVTSQKANGTYGIGELINIEVVFSENMVVTGTPQLVLETGVVDRVVNYASGSGSNTLVFAYTTLCGDESADLDYKATDALSLNSGTIKDVAGNNAVLTLASPGTANSLGTNKAIVVEAFPSVSLSVGSVSISENGGTTTITASLSEVSTQNVVVSLLYSGTAIRGADYNSNVSSTITIPAGSLSANASVGLATIQDVDAEGNETVIVDISSVSKGVENGTQQQTIIIVDDDLPTVTSIAVPANGFYKAGQTLDFVATFNQAVIINTQAGVPSIPLTIGADLKQAVLVGGVNGSNTATFRYTVLAGDEDKDGIQLGNSIELNGATIRNAEGLNAALLLYGVGNTSGVNVDAIVPNAPVIVSISTDTNTSGDGITNDSSLSIDGTAEANTFVELFIDAVSIGTTSVNSSGTWIFDHSSVNLSTGTYSVTAQVTDAAGNVSSLSAGFTIVVDLLAPTVVISADHVNLTNAALTVTFTFNEAVQNFASSDITVTNALVSNFAANSASVYSCIVTPIAEGTVTIDVAANVANDVAGNGNQAASTYSITYDQTSPTVIVSSVAANPTNAAIDAVITFSEPVSGFDLNDIIVVNGRLESLTDVNGSVYSISIIPAIDGIVTVRVPSVVAIDVAGNTNQESNVYSFVCDRTQPEVTITQTGINNAARSFTAEFNFTESITGFAASDIVLSSGVVNKFTALTTQKYSAEITKTTTAVVEMSLPESAVFDVANNPNKAGSLSVEFDYTPPTVHCRDTVLYLDENGAAVITAQEMDNHSSDEFGIAKRELNVSSFTCTQLGENKVVLTVTDNSGNTAFCEAKVTVKDRIVVLTKDISVLLNDKGEVTISPEQVNNSSFNSCGGLTYELDKTDFTCANMGENTVVLTAINAQGELATETATVSVRAINHQPSFTSLPDVTIAEDANYILVPVSGVATGDCTGSAQKVISMTAAFMSDLVERVEVAYTPGAESGMVKAYFKKNVFGTADIYVTIIDDGGTAEGGVNSYTSGFSVHILSQNDAPYAVRTVDPQMVTVGSSFSYQIPSDLFVDPDEGDAISYSVAAKSGSFPAWLKYDQAEQRLYGTPSSTDVGNLFVRLIATDQTGASGNTFVEIIVYQNSFSSITGSVYEKSTLLNGGAMVNLYELVSTNPKPTYKYITRTTVSQAGNFGFYNLTAGDYIVEASVVDTVRYNSMMTTYYEKSIGWENAKVIPLDGNSNKHIDMVMLEKPVRTTGVYRIFGVIIAKTGDQQKSGLILKGTAEDSGNPLEGITIHLKQNNQIIETTQTDENGYYEFASLPEGLYQIEVVYPGFEQQEAIVVEKTEEQPKEDPVNFTVWEGIQVITDVDEIRVKLNVSMFPNPTHGELTVRLNTLASEKVDIQVFSVSGQLVYQQSFLPSYEYSIDLSNQYPGVYLVQVKTGLQNAIERIVIK